MKKIPLLTLALLIVGAASPVNTMIATNGIDFNGIDLQGTQLHTAPMIASGARPKANPVINLGSLKIEKVVRLAGR